MLVVGVLTQLLAGWVCGAASQTDINTRLRLLLLLPCR